MIKRACSCTLVYKSIRVDSVSWVLKNVLEPAGKLRVCVGKCAANMVGGIRGERW